MMATELSPTIQTTQDDDKTGEITPQAPSRTSLMEFERQLNNVANANQQTSAATEAVPAKPAVQSPAAKVSSPSVTTTVPGRNALLARVQAAQQRARLAQEKQKQAQLERENALKEEEKILEELNGVCIDGTNETTSTTEHPEPTSTELKDPPPLENTDLSTSVQLGAFLNNTVEATKPTTSPSAPPAHDMQNHETNISDESKIASSQQHSQQTEEHPPTFDQFEVHYDNNEIDEAAFQLDEDGTEMTPEQKSEMILEQERILKQIQEEHDANMAAIAAATAGDDNVNVNALPPDAAAESAVPSPVTNAATDNYRTVEIGPNRKVALHGQDRTKAAIADGTAVLVQCLNCQNWMQVTPSATLMFCPVCQVVSPVEHQSTVKTTEEAMRLSLDRKMAEKIQNEEWAAGKKSDLGNKEGFLSSFKNSVFGDSSNAVTGVISEEHRGLVSTNSNQARAAQTKKSWGEYLSSLMYTPPSEENDANSKPRSAEIVVGKKPSSNLQGASTAAKASIYGGDDTTEEIHFDQDNDNEQSSLLPGLVAESKPLFSCVVESVSNILHGQNELPDGELHGVDTSSLLSVTEAGRDDGNRNDGQGEYKNLNTF